MVKKSLLSLGLAAMAFTANAQTPVFHEGFDAELTKAKTELGWYEFINSQAGDSRVIVADEQFAGAGCLQIINDPGTTCENQGWQRAIKFRNLPLESGKIYQIDFAFKGSNRYNKEGGEVDPVNDPRCEMRVGLMQGYENSDISILDAKGGDQTKTVSQFNPENYEQYSYKFYFASKENQDAQYQAQGKDIQYINDYFVTMNIINPGTFYLDEFTLTEINSAVEAITYGGEGTIRVKYMFDTTISGLAKAEANGRVLLDPSCAKVTIDGEAQDIQAVELHKDGYLYVFLNDMAWDEATESEILVSFTNPNEIVNFVGDNKDAKLFAFEAVKAAEYDANLADIYSFYWMEPVLVSSNPANNSFCLEETISEFTLTFDHKIYTCDNDYADPPTAVLSTGEKLAIKPGQPELSESITFVRTGTDPLTKGMYKITVSDITSEAGITMGEDAFISFETGKIKMAEIVYSDPVITLLSGGNGGQPEGWSIMVGGADWDGGDPKADNGSACRNLNVTGTNGVEYTAFYLCDREGYTYMKYNEPITLPAGNVEFSLIALSHDDPGHTAEFRLEDLEGNVVANASGACAVVANSQFTTIEASDYVVAKFNNPAEKQVILKARAPQGGYTAVRVLGFRVRTYEETPGEKFEPEIIFDSKFTGGNMPAEGSGWLCYDNNNELAPGSGRNQTSGMLERNFHAKMQSAAFFRECGENADAAHRIEYGRGNGIENGIEIPEGSFEVTYYAGTWNDAAGNAAGTSKVFMQIIDAETGEIAFNSEHVNKANFENGGACNGQADMVVEPFNCKGGKYWIKAWGTNNTVWGSLSIIKPGSKAAQYYSKMQDAVDAAKAELEKCEDEKYNGTAKSALIAAIEKCSDPSDMHTVEEFEAAIADLKAKQDAMADRRVAMGNYEDIIEKSGKILTDNAENKFAKLEEYEALNTLYTKYSETPAQSLENEELLPATADMQKYYSMLDGLIKDGIPALTEQIVKAAAQIVALNPEMENNEVVLSAHELLAYDAKLHNTLKLMVTKAIYEKLGNGENIFEKYVIDENDPELNYTEAVKFDLSYYAENPNAYIISAKHEGCKISDYPGWNSDRPDFGMRPNYGWGGWTGSDTHLINNNMFIGIGWVGDEGVNVWTDVTGLPVGKYDFSIETMDRSGVGEWKDGANTWPNPERQISYIFYQQGDAEQTTQPFNVDNIGQYYGFTEDIIPDVEFTGETTADVKAGAYIHAQESFAAIQKVKFVLKARQEGFDYKKAAEKIAEELATSIEKTTVAPVGEPVKVEYYSLDGKKVAKATGIAIKVATYKNGVIQVSKFIAK